MNTAETNSDLIPLNNSLNQLFCHILWVFRLKQIIYQNEFFVLINLQKTNGIQREPEGETAKQTRTEEEEEEEEEEEKATEDGR